MQIQYHISIINHYFEDDEHCIGDYVKVDVEVNARIVAEYGDAAHDSGEERAKGFVDALQYIYGEENTKVYLEYVADIPI